MKRLLIMLSIFLVMLSLAFLEMGFTRNFYGHLYGHLQQVEQSMNENPDGLDNADTLEKMNKAMAHWDKYKNMVLMLGNHGVVRLADEKLESLERLLKLNEKSDAFVTVKLALNYVDELKDDTFPRLSNIL